DNLRIARIARLAGAPQVPDAGIDLLKKLGERVEAGEPLYRVHARFDADLAFARDLAGADGGFRVGEAAELPHEFASFATLGDAL
ncbi:MAG: thymidine phosphorylase, partial [Burkholderiaceae bacterium]|nr:thymidine phosphorylase [Burkholderiaceae bacterium]